MARHLTFCSAPLARDTSKAFSVVGILEQNYRHAETSSRAYFPFVRAAVAFEKSKAHWLIPDDIYGPGSLSIKEEMNCVERTSFS